MQASASRHRNEYGFLDHGGPRAALAILVWFVVSAGALPAPTSLITFVQGDSLRDVEVVWTDNADTEEGYAVERKENEGDWEEVDRTEADATSWVDERLDIGSTYNYRVRAFAGDEYSDYSNEDYAQITGVPYIYMTAPLYEEGGSNELRAGATVRVKWISNKVSEIRIIVMDSLGLNPVEYNDGPVRTSQDEWNNFPLTLPDSLLNRKIYVQVREYNDLVWDTQGPFLVTPSSAVRPFRMPDRIHTRPSSSGDRAGPLHFTLRGLRVPAPHARRVPARTVVRLVDGHGARRVIPLRP